MHKGDIMSLLNIDREKCHRDGICAAVCPARIIGWKRAEDYPEMVPGGDEICISCGHCVAVCPHGAMNHKRITASDCPPVRKEWLLGPEQTEHFLRNRRSTRAYKDKPVDRETLVRLVEIARYAPSGHNLQPVKWKIVENGKDVNRLSGIVIDWMRSLIAEKSPMVEMMHLDRAVAGWEQGIDPINRHAPHLVIAHGHKHDITAQTASTIALTYLELAATGFGLGACWAGYFTAAALFWPPLLEALELPGNHICCGALMIGHPRFKYHRLPLRNQPEITWL
jgi:nitroreductase/NAD-dependent dihydropyrimidine dehydrogenase PreA subunit